jgi:SAM-dependent methyltransferase
VKRHDAADLTRLKSDWEQLGASDPLWAVYVTPQARHGGWDVEEFLGTGRREIDDSWRRFTDAVGGPPPPDGVVVDFGCGVGRLSAALAERSRFVVGIDISESMLGMAGQVIPTGLRERIALVASSSPHLPLGTNSVDLVYTSLVLQHMPSHLAVGYVREFMRVLKPGGYAMVQVAERPDASAKGIAFRLLPAWAYGAIQRTILGYPAPMRMEGLPLDVVRDAVASCGGQLIHHWGDPSYGGHWSYRRLLLRRQDG